MRNAEDFSTKGTELFFRSGDQGSPTKCQGTGETERPVRQQVSPESEPQSSDLKVSECMMALPELVQRLSAWAQSFVGGRLRPFLTNGNKLHLTSR